MISCVLGHNQLDKRFLAGLHKKQGTEYTERQWPLYGVHSIMRVKSAQADEDGECTPKSLLLYLPSPKL